MTDERQVTRDLMAKVAIDIEGVLKRSAAICDSNSQRFEVVLTAVAVSLGHAAGFYRILTPGAPDDASGCVNAVMDIIREQNAEALESRKVVQ